MIEFDVAKKKTLKRMKGSDKSNKGSVDKPILSLVNLINSLDNYYTTSSCSGRIIVIKIPKNGSKRDAEFIYRTHSLTSINQLSSVIKQSLNYGGGSVWFRQEPAIIHVAARTLNDASRFLRIARRIGFKRNGIFEIKKRVLMELVSTERIDAILVRNGTFLVTENYLKILIEEANKRLERTWEKTKKLKSTIKVSTS